MNKAETERQRMPKTYMDLCVKWAGNRAEVPRDSATLKAALDAPGSTMTVGQVYRALLELDLSAADSLWHLRWASWLRERYHGPLSQALLSAPNLEVGLNTATRFFPTRLPYLKFGLATVDDEAAFTIGAHWTPPKIHFELVETPLYIIFDYIASFASLDMMQANVLLERTRPPDADEYRNWFGCPVRFETGCNGIVVPHTWLSIPNPEFDEGAWRAALGKCEALVPQATRHAEVSKHVRRIIYDAVEAGRAASDVPALGAIAAELNISVRTLIRRLQRQGTSYQQIIDDIQKARATTLLEVPGLRITDIASRLGYQDTANFGRAFRRWFDVSPGKFRQQLAADYREPPIEM